MLLEIDTDKILISGTGRSGKSELGVSLSYGSLKLGARVHYVTNSGKVSVIEERFRAKDEEKELNIVDINMLRISDVGTLGEIDSSYDIYVFDRLEVEEVERIVEKVIEYEESEGRDVDDIGIVMITTTETDTIGNAVVSRTLRNLFNKYINIQSSTLIEDTGEWLTYKMRLNRLELDYLINIDDDVTLKMKAEN